LYLPLGLVLEHWPVDSALVVAALFVVFFGGCDCSQNIINTLQGSLKLDALYKHYHHLTRKFEIRCSIQILSPTSDVVRWTCKQDVLIDSCAPCLDLNIDNMYCNY
jgi:hypothetical protein